jgi:hypothetical protein
MEPDGRSRSALAQGFLSFLAGDAAAEHAASHGQPIISCAGSFVAIANVSADSDHPFANIVVRQKPDQGGRQVLEAVDDILAHLELTALDPAPKAMKSSCAAFTASMPVEEIRSRQNPKSIAAPITAGFVTLPRERPSLANSIPLRGLVSQK